MPPTDDENIKFSCEFACQIYSANAVLKTVSVDIQSLHVFVFIHLN